MAEKSFYVTIRIDLESTNKNITEDKVQQIVSEMAYDISYNDGRTKIVNHEIKDIQ